MTPETEPEKVAISADLRQRLAQLASSRGVSADRILRELLQPAAAKEAEKAEEKSKNEPPDFAEMMRQRAETMMNVQLAKMFGGGKEEEDPVDKYVALATKLTLARSLPKMLGGGDDDVTRALQAAATAKEQKLLEELTGVRENSAKQAQDSARALEEFKKEIEKREHERTLKEVEEKAERERQQWLAEREELREQMNELRNEMRNQPKPPSDLDMLDRATQTMVSVEERRAALRRALSGMAGYAKDAEEKGNKTDAEKVKEWIELISEGAATATDILGRAQGIRKASPPAAPAQGSPPGSNYPAQPPTQASPEPKMPPARVDEPIYVEADTGNLLSRSQWLWKYGQEPVLLPQPGAPPPAPPPAEPTPAPKEAPSPPPPPATPPEPAPSEAAPPASAPITDEKATQTLQGDEV